MPTCLNPGSHGHITCASSCTHECPLCEREVAPYPLTGTLKEWKALDGRTKDNKGQVWGPLGWMDRVYCVNCGKPGGLVTHDWIEYIFYLCDYCQETVGRLPLPELPKEWEEQNVQQEV